MTARDEASNEVSVSRTFVINAVDFPDTVPPSLTLDMPASGLVAKTDTVRIAGAAADEGVVVDISFSLDGGTSTPIDIDPSTAVTFSAILRGMEIGEHQLTVTATDSSANVAALTRSFRIDPPPLDPAKLTLKEVASGLSRPVHLTAPAGDDRLFIVEQAGTVRIVQTGSVLPTPFIDISAKVTLGSEEGLLGLAFHPMYGQNGYFYLFYIDGNRDTRVERYQVSGDANVANPSSAKLILTADQPPDSPHHKGGTMFFDREGRLMMSLGDGAAAGDFYRNAQNKATLLGAVLRIDVDRGDPYAIPAANPFVGDAGAKGELVAIGLRNPWRISYDSATGLVYVPDVGEDTWEEINILYPSTGANFGWPQTEGTGCFFPYPDCDPSAYVAPTLAYSHDDGCSVIGGFVYHGDAIPALDGHYLYSDFCTGFLRSFRYQNGQAVDKRDWPFNPGPFVRAFGEGGDGELYIIKTEGTYGKVLRLEPK